MRTGAGRGSRGAPPLVTRRGSASGRTGEETEASPSDHEVVSAPSPPIVPLAGKERRRIDEPFRYSNVTQPLALVGRDRFGHRPFVPTTVMSRQGGVAVVPFWRQ